MTVCFVREDDKDLCKHNSIVLPQFYQTELLFRSHDQMGHQGLEKVYNRIQKRFEWPGLKKACDKWISACLSYQQAKDPRKLRFPLQSVESSEFNEVVQINHQKICMTATGYNQVLVMIDHFTKYAEATPCMTASADARLVGVHSRPGACEGPSTKRGGFVWNPVRHVKALHVNHLQPFAGGLQKKQKLRRPAPVDDPGRQRRLPREETETDRHGSPGPFPG